MTRARPFTGKLVHCLDHGTTPLVSRARVLTPGLWCPNAFGTMSSLQPPPKNKHEHTTQTFTHISHSTVGVVWPIFPVVGYYGHYEARVGYEG